MFKALMTIIMLIGYGYIFKNDSINDKYEVAYTGLCVVIFILMFLF